MVVSTATVFIGKRRRGQDRYHLPEISARTPRLAVRDIVIARLFTFELVGVLCQLRTVATIVNTFRFLDARVYLLQSDGHA